MPGGGDATVDRLERFLEKGGDIYRGPLRAGLVALDAASVAQTGRPYASLPLARQASLLERWTLNDSARIRQVVRGLLMPLKQAHYDDPALFAHVGCDYGRPGVTQNAQAERRPWMRQVTDGHAATADLRLHCEVVVVGSGAGGAAAAYELARRGRAVVLLEGGRFHGREAFTGRAGDAFHRQYLARGATFALGNLGAPIWAGRGVGGTTTINSGTCYRVPDSTLVDWQRDFGLTSLTSAALSPYFQRVEAMLQVEPGAPEHLGNVARVIARGAEAMGLSHHPLPRNAPGCDGQGVCCFGCPTGAKRSADVSYVPEALKRGATLVTGAEVDEVLTRDGRAAGVVGRLASGHTFRVTAETVIVAGGSLLTPLLLRRSGLCLESGQLGRNLSIHPATKVLALFHETIDMSRGIPQSYGIDSFAAEGLMFEGSSTPFDVTALAVPWVGPRFTEVMERFPQLASFGFMVKDTSRGRVMAGPNGLPLLHYSLNERDTRQMQRGIEILCELYLRAGAERVLPMVHGCPEIVDDAGLERLRGLRLRPGDFDVAAFHPLGTCRRGTDPRRSCVGPEGEAHHTPGLYVADGSTLPSSLGVNPQMTIMALALRTAEVVDSSLSRAHAHPALQTPQDTTMAPRRITFNETMSGVWRRDGSPADRPFTFHVDAASERLASFARRREVTIRGTLDAETLATSQPMEGTLGLDFLLTRTLPYDFTFTGDDGESYRFSGKKTIRLSKGLESFTKMVGEIVDSAGERVGTAELHFDLWNDLVPFLASWRIESRA